jgi:hypothetical protein
MTIAMCYMSPEGVVLGADSTSSHFSPGFHHYDYNQKLFELGERSTLAMLTWGLGGLGSTSHRTLFSNLSDELTANPPSSVMDAAATWTDQFWVEHQSYSSTPEAIQLLARCKALDAKTAFVKGTSNPPPTARTEAEEREYQTIIGLFFVGFCIAGRAPGNRLLEAVSVLFHPLRGKPVPIAQPMNSFSFWGAPNMIKRLVWGYDEELEASILSSNKWAGSASELRALLDQQRLQHGPLPIREAIDFVHSCIYSTIKGIKFSNREQICGGPIEIGVVTSDRPFRWVMHKDMDAAITQGERL